LGFTDDDFADGGSDRLIDALVAWGDEAAIAARVKEHRDAGADHVCIQVVSDDATALRDQWRALAPALT
ncbi:MAG TPA: LLM class F420-dependent oxidoreductase, partial [Mycobacteriales bacterium]|nr:LLM class F420-dependent oxidoreductase [Mycobacteriales bacterium]